MRWPRRKQWGVEDPSWLFDGKPYVWRMTSKKDAERTLALFNAQVGIEGPCRIVEVPR